jgi:two-component system cell cycle sensor histidine kinase/response regulator CckA
MRVLVVDDNPVKRRLLRVALEKGGHKAVGAVDGVEALARLRGGGFDAVISDVLMPRMDGYRLCYEIRRSEELQALPIIIYSSTYTSEADERQAMRAGADQFIRKLVITRTILDALAQVREHKEPQKKPARFLRELATLKEYSEGLVRKLEHRNEELETTRDWLAAANLALQQSEESFRRAFLASPVATCLTELKTGRFIDVNDSMTKMLGYERGELLGGTSIELGIWEDLAEREQIVAAVRASIPVRESELRLRTKSGEVRQVLVSAELMLIGKDQVLLSTFHDITERRRAQEALRESEERYRALFELNPFPLWVFDPQTLAFLAVNAAAVEHYGYSHDEFLAMSLRDLHPPDDLPRFHQSYRTELTSTHIGVRRHRKKDGTVVEVDIYAHEVLLGGRTLRVALLRDVTEQKRLEGQFRQAQKMEAIGRLTSGIAHDFNNLLTPILGFSDILAKKTGNREEFRQEIEEIRKAGERAAVLTRQLLAFSRQQVLSPEVIDLNAIVADMEKMLLRVIGEDLELSVVLEPHLGHVKADRGQIEQVIMNLVVNARDAMPAGGRLTIETKNAELDDAYVETHMAGLPGLYAMLAVTDSGTGMDDQTKARIFEPFFTTKEPGKGTGLGLSTIYGIVKQSDGYIWVYSEPGRGTTFKVYLPRIEEPLVGLVPAVRPTESSLEGTETILVAEDDNAVRLVTRLALERYGYRVLLASSGAEALEMVRRHAGPIQLLLTDMLMPGMIGPELASQVTALRGEIKVVFMSGYSRTVIAGQADLAGKLALLEKPFTAEALARKVRQALAS